MKTAVKNVQGWRATHLDFCAQRDADIGKKHACRFNDAHQHRQECWKLWRDMVGTLGIGLAVGLAERTVIIDWAAVTGRHVGTRFGHCRRRTAAFHLVTATGTGVRDRCQLNCQENNKKEAGEPRAPAGSVTQEFFAVE